MIVVYHSLNRTWQRVCRLVVYGLWHKKKDIFILFIYLFLLCISYYYISSSYSTLLFSHWLMKILFFSERTSPLHTYFSCYLLSVVISLVTKKNNPIIHHSSLLYILFDIVAICNKQYYWGGDYYYTIYY